VFVGWINGKITYEEFCRIALVIDREFIGDLINLKRYYQSIEQYKIGESKSFHEYLDDATCQSLYNSQLVRAEWFTESIYYKSKIGETLLRLLEEP
jgi:hypothetical protein